MISSVQSQLRGLFSPRKNDTPVLLTLDDKDMNAVINFFPWTSICLEQSMLLGCLIVLDIFLGSILFIPIRLISTSLIIFIRIPILLLTSARLEKTRTLEIYLQQRTSYFV